MINKINEIDEMDKYKSFLIDVCTPHRDIKIAYDLAQ